MSLKSPSETRTKQGMLVVGLGLILGLLLPVSASSAQTGPSADTARGGPNGIVEVNVANVPDRDNGQPAVAVSPKNRNNVVVVSTNHRPGVGTPDKYHCFVTYSRDGGANWTEVPWPYGDRAMCGDPNVVVDTRGIFYLAFNRLGCEPGVPTSGSPGNCNGVPNHVGVAKSLDGGRTWSDPVDTPLVISSTPRLRVDTATGWVYAIGGSAPSAPHAVSVSKDRGLTWGPAGILPSQPLGNQVAVHDGILATATGMTVVNGSQLVPAEPTFYVSRDGGQTFASSLVTNSAGTPVPPAAGALVPNPGAEVTDPIPWVSADPTRSGRFAVLLPRGDNLEVYITKDAGQTWTGPTVIAAPGAVKPWIEYGSTGLLGVMWRTVAVDVFSVASFDHGKTFSKPLKVNQATQPYGSGRIEGDEWSRITLDGKYAYITWADARAGGSDIDGIVSRVPVSRY